MKYPRSKIQTLEELKKKMCGKKIKHNSAKNCKKAFLETYKDKNYTYRVTIYECPFCNKWHLGNTKLTFK